MAFSTRGLGEEEHSELADINVTPLVDVMLVLLIIFMITAPMLHQGIEVDLPDTEAAENLPLDIDDPLVLSLKADGLVYVRDQPVHPTKVVDTLTPILAGRDDQSVFLKGDRNVPYGEFVQLVDLLYQGGIRQIGLVTENVGRP